MTTIISIMTNTFDADLKYGKIGEEAFHKLFPRFTHNTDRDGIDFYFDKPDGSRIWVEVKTSDAHSWCGDIEHSWNKTATKHFIKAAQIIATGSSDKVLVAKCYRNTWTLYDVVALQKRISAGVLKTEEVTGQLKPCTKVKATDAILAQHYKP